MPNPQQVGLKSPSKHDRFYQSKILLSATKIDEIQVTGEQLKNIRKKGRLTYQQDSISQVSQSDIQQEQAVSEYSLWSLDIE
ncbi:9701_t:CDS:2 [Ambispora leptoticha]|uniref:9701_t:CDS:1 n=1 Tax=Ambispora leptoticha TaxID=144679 RepID=A0A9N8VTX9_9GLOM|nr:9701_t:CDS:2 [Ambispora leptoticha]